MIGTVTLTNVIEYGLSTDAGIEEAQPIDEPESYWYPKDNIKIPLKYGIVVKGTNSLINEIEVLFRLHTWQGLCDDGDGYDEWSVLVTDMEITYAINDIDSDQHRIKLEFYRRPPDDLVLWVKMDYGEGGIAFDSSKYKSHGTITDATWATGKHGKCLSFNGTTAYIDVHAPSQLRVAHPSVEAWFKTSSSQQKLMVFRWRNYGYGLLMSPNATIGPEGDVGALRFFIYQLTPPPTVPEYVDSPLTYNDGVWHHVVGVYDGSYLRLYVDGYEVANTPVSITIHYTAVEEATISKDGSADSGYWVGEIDEVRIYGRALSADEVLELYNRWA